MHAHFEGIWYNRVAWSKLTAGWVNGVILHPFSSVTPPPAISRVISSPANTTSWSGPTCKLAALTEDIVFVVACSNQNNYALCFTVNMEIYY